MLFILRIQAGVSLKTATRSGLSINLELKRSGGRSWSMRTYLRRRQKNPYFHRIGDVLTETLKRKNLAIHIKDGQLEFAWNMAVGPLIAAQTTVDKVANETLFIKVSNAIWLQQLHFMKQEIIEKANHALGKNIIKRIFFSIGSIATAPTQKGGEFNLTQGRTSLTEKEIRTIEKCTALVHDGELCDLLKRLISKDLIRRRSAKED